MTICRQTRWSILLVQAPIAALLHNTALAYVGPGVGITMLGSLWALIIAILLALVGILAWPIRRLLRRIRKRNKTTESTAAEKNQGPNPSDLDQARTIKDKRPY